MQSLAGLRPKSPDDKPIIGLLPGWDNVYIATGHGRKGILLSAVAGQTMAQLMANDNVPFPIASFDPARFAAN